MNAKTIERLKLVFAIATMAVATVGFIRFFKSSSPAEGKAYFYDLSGKKLFTAPHSSVPPIKGIVGDEEDGVRAIVISSSGNCADEKSRVIAYLETYTPELKRQVESRLSNNSTPVESPGTIRRGEAHGFILVKRPDETDWHPMSTPEGQQILQSISTPDSVGKMPVVCVP